MVSQWDLFGIKWAGDTVRFGTEKKEEGRCDKVRYLPRMFQLSSLEGEIMPAVQATGR